MTGSTRRTLDAFRGLRVLVVGDVMLDEYVLGDCSRLSPEAPVAIVAVSSSKATLGGAANTAHNISSLGGHAVLVGLVGDDEAGRKLGAQLESAGITFVPITDGRPTIRKIRVLGQQQQLLRLDYEESRQLDVSTANQVMAAVEEHLPECAAVVISDYAKGLLTESLCQRILGATRAAGRRAIVDPRPQHASFYSGCDVITPNWKEARGLAGLVELPATPETISATGEAVARRLGCSVLLTLGAKGMTFFDSTGTEQFNEPSIAREVFDVSGAGDTVVAALTLALVAGCPPRDAVRFANQAAGIVVGKLGTATVTAAELLADESPDRSPIGREQLAPIASRLRAQGRRIVTINGTFDVLHAGHIHILEEARSQGDVLIVGLNSDESVRSLKGSGRPYINQADRARMLLALRQVDYVHIFDETVPMPFLSEVRPHVHVNGSEYGAKCIEADLVQSMGGQLHIVERIPKLSTSELIARIAASARGESDAKPMPRQ